MKEFSTEMMKIYLEDNNDVDKMIELLKEHEFN